jgi:hypothetical protein
VSRRGRAERHGTLKAAARPQPNLPRRRCRKAALSGGRSPASGPGPGLGRAGGGRDLVGGHRVNHRPASWFRGAKPAAPNDQGGNSAGSGTGSRPGRGSAPSKGNGPAVQLPTRAGAGVGWPSAGKGTGAPVRRWPDQPSLRSAPGGPGRASGPARRSAGARRRRARWQLALAVLSGLVVVGLILVTAGYSYLNSKLTHVSALVPTANAHGAGDGAPPRS